MRYNILKTAKTDRVTKELIDMIIHVLNVDKYDITEYKLRSMLTLPSPAAQLLEHEVYQGPETRPPPTVLYAAKLSLG